MNQPRIKAEVKGGMARLSLAGAEELPWLGAAYSAGAEAFVLLSRRGRASVATLWAKRGRRLSEVVAGFESEYRNQVLRWELSSAGGPIRAETLRLALALAERSGAEPSRAPASLSPEAASEIERLLAEAEAAPRDPLGIATTWEETRRRGA